MTRFLRLALLVGLVAPVTLAAQTPQGRLAPGAVRAMDPMRDSAITRLETFLRQYPQSEGRARALFQLGELLVRRADERFAETQRAGGAGDTTAASDAPIKPDYREAIARYEELVRSHPDFDRRAEAAYTLGTLYAGEQRYADAARMFEIVVRQDSAGADSAGILAPSYFRLGDARFELAAAARGDARRAGFARAAQAYERAVQSADTTGDIYFLSLYKLGWSYYNQANRSNQAEYRQAVETFGRLVQAYDKLTPEQQSRLGLRGEALEYMAVAFTQVGGAEAANQYFARAGGDVYRRQVIGRVAASLRDQGAFPEAIEAYREYITLAPTDTAALSAQIEIVDIYQNRMIEPEQAQAARLALVDRFGPQSEWARANPQLAQRADSAREAALRQSAQYLLASAQEGNRARYAEAATLYERYLQAFPGSDSARVVSAYLGDAYIGQREWMRAGAAFSRAAFSGDTSAFAELAARNAIVAFDSAVVRARQDRAAQDSLFAVVDRYVAAYPQGDAAKNALRQKGLRASETERWDVLQQTFRTYAQLYPNDPYTPTAEKLVADAMYRQGQYAEARVQWDRAEGIARQRGNRALADSISRTRASAASMFADTLVARGEYRRAAEEVYVAFVDKEPQHPEAPDALRNAIETYRIAIDSAQKLGLDATQVRQAKERAADLSLRLVQQYPNYQYRRQYQALGAQLLAETGRRDEAANALRELIAQNPRWEGRADAMVALASVLDSLDRHAEAAEAYASFSQTYPRDPRAPDALYNAAVTYVEAGDSVAAARTYGQFASRFSRDDRAGQARSAQVALLRASGNTEAADTELARLCSGNVTGDLRATCAERTARRAFEQGVALWDDYRSERLVIASRGQLTQAGVRRASATKQQLLRRMTEQFTRAIQAGNPEYLAAATYHIGLAQWEYGRFLENVQLPDALSAEEREAAQAGSRQQAQEFYGAARQTWQELIRKAEAEPELGGDAGAAGWVERARRAAGGEVPATPPTAMIERGAAAGRTV
ncbi:MAG TPA: tetratricopeptide repeat protein [Gemmatimonadaceae bacterium]